MMSLEFPASGNWDPGLPVRISMLCSKHSAKVKKSDWICKVKVAANAPLVVFVCTSGQACVSKLLELHDAASIVDLTPTVVLIDIPHGSLPSGSESYNQTPSPSSARQDRDPPGTEFADERFYGLPLLQWIVSDIQQQRLPKLVVPVAMVSIPEPDIDAETPFKYEPIIGPSISMPSDQMRTLGFLDVGAADVLTSPLIRERLPGLAVHAYQAYKDLAQRSEFDSKVKKQRKRSWVGLDGQKPYAYLREAMVSGLMDGICGLDDAERDSISNVQIFISDERHEEIIEAIASWDFSAHDFTDDELIHGAKLMLEHALSMPGLEQWRIPAGKRLDSPCLGFHCKVQDADVYKQRISKLFW